MKRGSHERNEKSMDQEAERESFREGSGCCQLQRKRLTAVFLPLCAKTGLEVPDGPAISDKDLLQCLDFCPVD